MVDSDELDRLLKTLANGGLEEQIKASAVLTLVGEPAVLPLIELLMNSEHRNVWWLVAKALGNIGDKRAVEPLVGLLQNPLSYEALLARKYTVSALGKLKDPRAVDVLIEALHILENATDEDITDVEEPDSETIEAVEDALAEIGDLRALQPILERMIADRYQDGDELIKWGEAALKLLLNELNGEISVRRAVAASFLDGIVDQQGVEPLINILQNDSTPTIRSAAAYYFGELQDPRTFEALLSALTDSDERTRELAAEALGNLKDARAANALNKATQDASLSVRQSARWALDNMPKSSTK